MPKVKYYTNEGSRNYINAQRAWIILTGYVTYGQDHCGFGRGIITYSELGNLMGYDGGSVMIMPVKLIHRFCEDNELPFLNAMVVNAKTGIAGWEEMFPDVDRYKTEQEMVRKFNWYGVRPPAPSVFKSYISS